MADCKSSGSSLKISPVGLWASGSAKSLIPDRLIWPRSYGAPLPVLDGFRIRSSPSAPSTFRISSPNPKANN
jgi:hypothetical protein